MFSCIELILKKRAERRVVPVLQSSQTAYNFERDLTGAYFQELAERSIEQSNPSTVLPHDGDGIGALKENRPGTLRTFVKRAKGLFKKIKCFRKSPNRSVSTDLCSIDDAELDFRLMMLNPNYTPLPYNWDADEEERRPSFLRNLLRCFGKFRCCGVKSDSLSEGPEWPSNPTLEEIGLLIAGKPLPDPSADEIDIRIKKLNPNYVPLPCGWDADEEATEKDSQSCFSYFEKCRCRKEKSDSLTEGPEWPSNPTLEEIGLLIAGKPLPDPSVDEIDIRIKKLNPNYVPLPYGWDANEEATEKDSQSCFSYFRKLRCRDTTSDSLSEGPEWPDNPTLEEIDFLIAGKPLPDPSVDEIDIRIKKLNPNHIPLTYDWDADEEATENVYQS